MRSLGGSYPMMYLESKFTLEMIFTRRHPCNGHKPFRHMFQEKRNIWALFQRFLTPSRLSINQSPHEAREALRQHDAGAHAKILAVINIPIPDAFCSHLHPFFAYLFSDFECLLSQSLVMSFITMTISFFKVGGMLQRSQGRINREDRILLRATWIHLREVHQRDRGFLLAAAPPYH